MFAFPILLMSFAVACWVSALLIPPSGEAAPHLRVSANIAASTAAMIRYLRRDKRLWWGAMVTSWFWLVGIVVLSLLPPLIKNSIGGNEDTATTYLGMFSVAVGIGSWLAAAIARGRIVLGTTVAGAVLLGIFALDLGIGVWNTPADIGLRGPTEIFAAFIGVRAAFDLVGLAVGGGLFIVPAFAAVQAWAERGASRTHGGSRQRAQCRVHDRRDDCFRAAAAIRCRRAGAVRDHRRGDACRRAAIWRTMPKA